MSLSNSEHELLVETCTNMNVAAETCRQVLDMLRSLGASGVVDIATHNTASTVHAEASNLVHYSSAHGAYSGSMVAQFDRYAFEIKEDTARCGLSIYDETLGAKANNYPGLRFYRAFTDSNGELVESDVVDNNIGTMLARIMAYSRCAVNGVQTDLASSITFSGGKSGDGNNRAKTRMYFSVSNGTATVNLIEMNDTALQPFYGNNSVTLGTSQFPFAGIYLSTSPNVSSDARAKICISELETKYIDFINALHPVAFKYKTNGSEIIESDDAGEPVAVKETPGVRQHWGFIAQEVKEAMTSAGIEDAACWCLADKNDPDSRQSLRYEELIAPLVKAVQVLAAKVEALEAR